MKNNYLIKIQLFLLLLTIYFVVFAKLITNKYYLESVEVVNQYVLDNYVNDSNCFVSSNYNRLYKLKDGLKINAISYISCYDKELNLISDNYVISNVKLKNAYFGYIIQNFEKANYLYAFPLNNYTNKAKINKINKKLEKNNLKQAKNKAKIKLTIKKSDLLM